MKKSLTSSLFKHLDIHICDGTSTKFQWFTLMWIEELTEINNLLMIKIFFDENRLHFGILIGIFGRKRWLFDSEWKNREREWEEQKKKTNTQVVLLWFYDWSSRWVIHHRLVFSLYSEKIFFSIFIPSQVKASREKTNLIMFTSKKALLLIANGSEESEVVITIDVSILRKHLRAWCLFL